jgi:hypothetical protein
MPISGTTTSLMAAKFPSYLSSDWSALVLIITLAAANLSGLYQPGDGGYVDSVLLDGLRHRRRGHRALIGQRLRETTVT